MKLRHIAVGLALAWAAAVSSCASEVANAGEDPFGAGSDSSPPSEAPQESQDDSNPDTSSPLEPREDGTGASGEDAAESSEEPDARDDPESTGQDDPRPSAADPSQEPDAMDGAGMDPRGDADAPAMDEPMRSPLPPVSDYGERGPFEVTIVNGSGPNGQYTMFRPQTLGEDGFKHPIATWGNGITTTPMLYTELLSTFASHGFVLIASNSTSVTASMMTEGLDWLIEQNEAPGELQGHLDVMRAASIGYSLGGGAAVTTGSHPSVVTTVSFHGLQGEADRLHGPLLLFTSTGDTFVSAANFVTPTFNRSTVQTAYATLSGGSHLTPLGDAGDERAPAVAWLRLWVYDDQGGRDYFYGDDCRLCGAPWASYETKNWQ